MLNLRTLTVTFGFSCCDLLVQTELPAEQQSLTYLFVPALSGAAILIFVQWQLARQLARTPRARTTTAAVKSKCTRLFHVATVGGSDHGMA